MLKRLSHPKEKAALDNRMLWSEYLCSQISC